MTGILSIKKLDNIGPYKNFISPSDIRFSRINLLYGFNGSGKTTLSNSFNLVSDQLDEKERLTLASDLASNGNEDISLEISDDSKTYKYPKDLLKIYIFNSRFVSNHVYDGRKANIKSFKDGVLTKEQLSNPVIEDLQTRIGDDLDKIADISSFVESLEKLAADVKANLSKEWNKNIDKHRMPAGLEISNQPDDDSEDTEEELESLLEEEYLKFKMAKDQKALDDDLSLLRSIDSSVVEFPTDILDVLSRSVSGSSRDKVKGKIEKYSSCNLKHGTTQNWYEDGLRLLKVEETSECPLCESKIDDIDTIISDYESFFNDELGVLIGDLEKLITTLQSVSDKIELGVSDRKTLTTLVKKYQYQDLIGKSEEDALEAFSKKNLNKLIKSVIDLCESKKNQISMTLNETNISAINSANELHVAVVNDYEVLRQLAEKVIARIEASKFNERNAKKICKALYWKRFKAVSEQAYDSWDKKSSLIEVEGDSTPVLYGILNNSLVRYRTNVSNLEAEKAVELSKLKKETEYVNYFLSRLGVTKFTINTQDDGDISVHYSGVDPKQGIEHSLSDGEKTSLAFAYFLSKYKYEVIENQDVEESDCIVVLDDPVSSLDENRLFSTALLINEILFPLAAKVGSGENESIEWSGTKQAFVFSHNIIFLKFIGNIIDSVQNKGRCDLYLHNCTLSLLPNTLKNYQTSYYYKLDKIQGFVNGEITYEDAKDYIPNYIRVVIEAFISFKFARLKGKGNKYRPAMLDELIRHLNGYDFSNYTAVDSISDKDSLKSCLQTIKNITNPESHGTAQDITHIEYLPEAELLSVAQDTLNVIQYLDQLHFSASSNLAVGQ